MSERYERDAMIVQDYILRDGIVTRIVMRKIVSKDKGKGFFFVPEKMRKSLVIRYHDLSSHFGLDKTDKKIRK